MKIEQVYRNLVDTCKKLWAWVQIRRRNMIIAVCALIIIVIGTVLFVKIVLPILIAVFILIVLFKDDIKAFLNRFSTPPPLSLENDVVCWEIAKFFFEVMNDSNELLKTFIKMPRTYNDIFDPTAYREAYNNAPMLKLRIVRLLADISKDDCDFLKDALQNISDARLRDGYLYGFDWAIQAANDVQLVKIVSVYHTPLALHFDILLTNTPASVQAARLSDKPKPPLIVDDADPIFRGGD